MRGSYALRLKSEFKKPLRTPRNISGGRDSTITEALRIPHGVSKPSCDSSEATIGRVRASEVVNISAIRNSFQTSTNENTIAPMSDFDATGSAMRKKIA